MSQSTSESNTSNYSLLGDNASPLERALERVLSNALDDIHPPIPELRNAIKTPQHLLPYLALEKQVPEWESSDNEEQKRKTVKNQLQVFRKAGTTSGIELAMVGLGGTAEVEKWYEYGGKPYSMRVVSWIQHPPTEETIKRTQLRIEDSISLRDSFSLAIGYKTDGHIYTGGAVIVAPRIVVGPWVPPLVESSGQIYIGGAITAVMRVVAT